MSNINVAERIYIGRDLCGWGCLYKRLESGMKYLGTVEAISGSREFVVKSDSLVPDVDDLVCDLEGNRIGLIRRIFGPVECPYVVVAGKGPILASIVGEKVYCERSSKNGSRKGRN
ncbi:MAG: hypothetical protein MJY54_03300 [archaeon]|nr:hypothetical protein [archaeon]